MTMTDFDLLYAATGRCRCGAGLAHPQDHEAAMQLLAWVCSKVLKGEAALDAYEAAIRASERAKVEALVPQLERALGIIEHGAEMVGPDVYEFTVDEVIGEAASAIRAVLDAVRAGRAS